MLLRHAPARLALVGAPRRPATAPAELAFVVLAPLAVTVVQAVLVVQPPARLRTLSSRALRVAWFAVAVTVHAAVGLHWRFPFPGLDPRTGVGSGSTFGAAVAWHFGFGVLLMLNLSRMLMWALASAPPAPYDVLLAYRAAPAPPPMPKQKPETALPPSQPWLPLPLDLVFNLLLVPRGPGLQALCAVHHESAERLRRRFIVRRFMTALLMWIAMDTIESIARHPDVYPPAARRVVAPLWAAHAGVFGAWGPLLVAALFVLELNWALTFGFAAAGAGYALIWSDPDLDIWRTVPSAHVLSATSIRSLWNYHWHQMLRPVLAGLGGKPIARLARRLGASKTLTQVVFVFGVFSLSGLIHELGASYMSSRSLLDQPPGPAMKFFLLQALACVVEEAVSHSKRWARVRAHVPRPIRAAAGWMYTYSFLAWSGMDMVNAWFLYGCSAASVTPRAMAVLITRLLQTLPLPGPAVLY